MAPRPRTRGNGTSRKQPNNSNGLPGWIVAWFIITAIIQTWDATYILLRPHTSPGGKLNAFWRPYNLYRDIDLRYKDTEDSFGIAQSSLNLVEVLLAVIVLYLNQVGSKLTEILALILNTMTFWKTVLYMTMYLKFCKGADMIGTSDPILLTFCFLIPNCIWILLPGMSIMSIGKSLTSKLNGSESSAVSSKKES